MKTGSSRTVRSTRAKRIDRDPIQCDAGKTDRLQPAAKSQSIDRSIDRWKEKQKGVGEHDKSQQRNGVWAYGGACGDVQGARTSRVVGEVGLAAVALEVSAFEAVLGGRLPLLLWVRGLWEMFVVFGNVARRRQLVGHVSRLEVEVPREDARIILGEILRSQQRKR